MGSIQQEEGIAKSNPMLLGFGAVIYLSNLIWYGYPCLQLLGNEPSEMAYKVVNFFGSKLNVFSTPYITLVFALGMILMYAWAHRRPKTTNYVPPKMMRWIIPQLVRLGLHPEFEYKETSDKNGKMCLEKKRERIEGQAALSLGIFLVLVSVLPIVLVGTDSMLYILAFLLYFATSLMGILYSLLGADLIHSMNKDFEMDDSDSNNDLQESFLQCQTKIDDEYSVNWRTEFKYQGKIMKGWINLVNPFRATQVIGTPGSGKSYAVINEVIRQHLAKGRFAAARHPDQHYVSLLAQKLLINLFDHILTRFLAGEEFGRKYCLTHQHIQAILGTYALRPCILYKAGIQRVIYNIQKAFGMIKTADV